MEETKQPKESFHGAICGICQLLEAAQVVYKHTGKA
jgi:hypothetical protein